MPIAIDVRCAECKNTYNLEHHAECPNCGCSNLAAL